MDYLYKGFRVKFYNTKFDHLNLHSRGKFRILIAPISRFFVKLIAIRKLITNSTKSRLV